MNSTSKTLFSGRALVFVAHPDDETGGCAALLQRVRDPVVLFGTDGAPRDRYFWGRYGSREAYAGVRRQEAVQALKVVDVERVEFLSDMAADPGQFVDQNLFRVLPKAMERLAATVDYHRPDLLLTTAYEGGHPDHDSCSFIAHVVGRQMSLPVWEMPLYHRVGEQLVFQDFRQANGTEWRLCPSAAERRNKRLMLATYASQGNLTRFAEAETEVFRPQAAYNYAQPPHAGVLNYEQWQWPITGADVCRAFAQCENELAVTVTAISAGSRRRHEPTARGASAGTF